MKRVLMGVVIALALGLMVHAQAGITGKCQLKVWLDRQGPSMAAVFKRANEVNGAAESKLTGKWQGKTESGRQVVLDARVNGQHLTGRFTLAEQSAQITEGKVEGTTFSFTAGPLDGRTVTFQGRRVGDQVELTVEDVPSPLTLERVKAGTGR